MRASFFLTPPHRDVAERREAKSRFPLQTSQLGTTAPGCFCFLPRREPAHIRESKANSLVSDPSWQDVNNQPVYWKSVAIIPAPGHIIGRNPARACRKHPPGQKRGANPARTSGKVPSRQIIPIFHARPLQIIHARTRTVILSTAYPKTTVPPSFTESRSPDGLFHKKT